MCFVVLFLEPCFIYINTLPVRHLTIVLHKLHIPHIPLLRLLPYTILNFFISAFIFFLIPQRLIHCPPSIAHSNLLIS